MLFIDVINFILGLTALGLTGYFIFRLLGWKVEFFKGVGEGFDLDTPDCGECWECKPKGRAIQAREHTLADMEAVMASFEESL